MEKRYELGSSEVEGRSRNKERKIIESMENEK
jgi:hypothetical protein